MLEVLDKESRPVPVNNIQQTLGPPLARGLGGGFVESVNLMAYNLIS